MTDPWTGSPTSRRADMPVAEGELDADLARLVRRTSAVRQGFYVVVLLVALAGQVSGAVEALGIPLAAAIPAVAALELGGIVVLANADVRRRLGERAVASRLLSVAIAAGAVTFNWLAHKDHLLGGFFSGMSALGYLVWLMHTENQRRDRLRIKGDLPPTTPSYEVGGHWLRHPWLTMRARGLAKADPRLGLYDSLATARADIRRERRQAAIAKVLHRKIRSAVDPRTADIAIAVYDLEEIAARLAEQADYDGLTSLIAADLAPARLAPDGSLTERPSGRRGRKLTSAGRVPAQPASRKLESVDSLAPVRAAGVKRPASTGVSTAAVSAAAAGTAAIDTAAIDTAAIDTAAAGSAAVNTTAIGSRSRRSVAAGVAPPGPVAFRDPGPFDELVDFDGAVVAPDAEADGVTIDVEVPTSIEVDRRRAVVNGRHSVPNQGSVPTQGDFIDVGRNGRRNTDTVTPVARAPRPTDQVPTPPTPPSSLFTDLRRDLSHLQPTRAQARATAPPADEPPADLNPVVTETSLRRRVHRALDANVVPGDQRDDTELLALVFDELGLTDLERLSAQSYVRSWLLEMRTGERIRTA